MKTNFKIPLVPFYFVRHGQTDWNKTDTGLCPQDDIPLNEIGEKQAINVRRQLINLKINKIYSSPLTRAKQTSEIINEQLLVPLELVGGLGNISPEIISQTFSNILNASHSILIVSHGEIYRILVNELNAKFCDEKAKNCGLYFFQPPDLVCHQWQVNILG